MSFTDGTRQIATAEDLARNWSGGKNGKNFRCGMCGHKFKLGEGWRFQISSNATFKDANGKSWGVKNLLVCDACDGPTLLGRWVAKHHEFHSDKFWSLR